MRVKITAPGWANYTGAFGTANFEKGIAEVSPIEANRIAANVSMVEIDEDGEVLGPIGPSAEQFRQKGMSAPVVTYAEGVEEKVEEVATADIVVAEADAGDAVITVVTDEATAASPEDSSAVNTVAETVAAGSASAAAATSVNTAAASASDNGADAVSENSALPTYTREQLESVADEKGIKGLREIAEPLAVSGRSVGDLIERIVEAQK